MLLATDRKLLEGFRRGCPEALSRVYREYSPQIVQVLRHGFTFSAAGKAKRFRGVQSAYDLDDLLQEIFLKAFSDKVRQGYDGISPFAPYLKTIARNHLIDILRKKNLEDLVLDNEDASAEPRAVTANPSDPLRAEVQGTGAPSSDLETVEIAKLVQAFVRTLSARELVVYEKRFLEGLGLEQTSSLCALSISQIRTSEKRIRLAFFSYMRKSGYFEGYVQNEKGVLSRIERLFGGKR